jgi:hypothetical protein
VYGELSWVFKNEDPKKALLRVETKKSMKEEWFRERELQASGLNAKSLGKRHNQKILWEKTSETGGG